MGMTIYRQIPSVYGQSVGVKGSKVYGLSVGILFAYLISRVACVVRPNRVIKIGIQQF